MYVLPPPPVGGVLAVLQCFAVLYHCFAVFPQTRLHLALLTPQFWFKGGITQEAGLKSWPGLSTLARVLLCSLL